MFSLGGALIGLQNQANLQSNLWGYAPRKGYDNWSVGSANASDFWTPERMANWSKTQGDPSLYHAPTVAKTNEEKGISQPLPKLGGAGSTAALGQIAQPAQGPHGQGPQPVASPQTPSYGLARAVRGKRDAMQGGGGMHGAPSLAGLNAMAGQG